VSTSASPNLLIIAGATASGKTALAIDVCEEIGGELVGADSVQIYRGVDIGSAKPTATELRGIRHHLLDVVDIGEPFDAARYVALADEAIVSIGARGRVPIVVGGAGLYVRALVYGLADDLASDAAIRARLNARASESEDSLRAMHREVQTIDREYAARIEPTDPIRIVRALEVYEATGVALSAHHARHRAQPPRYDATIVALNVERATLRARIAERTDAMLAKGWVNEVRDLLARGVAADAKPLRSVGYAQVVDHVLGTLAYDAMRERIVIETAAFAKRQRTWFRGERNVQWIDANRDRAEVLRDVLARR